MQYTPAQEEYNDGFYNPVQYAYPQPTFYSIDVECLAVGKDHNARSPGQISLVDEYERVLLNLYVKPKQPIVSYLTPLTGLTREMIETYGVSLDEALVTLKAALPKHAVLVGQSIGQDVTWLGLKEGVDFKGMIDLVGLFRVFNKQYNSWSVFGQDHLAKVLLGIPKGEAHNAVGDALKSIQLYNLYKRLEANKQLEPAKASLLEVPPEASFARKNPTFEGVCMGNRKTCSCGAPFLG